ncbi:MAG: glutamine-hydrolyzing GMP synthase, partial [Acidimicrobiia bacterium]
MTIRDGSFGQASTGDFDRVLVVDLGAQYAQLIARRVREAHVLSEIVPRDITAAEITARRPSGLILSGGPASVYADDAYEIDPDIFDLDVPILGICYGHQVIAHRLGGRVAQTGSAEYGKTELRVLDGSGLFAELPETQDVWMSHGDAVVEAPPGFRVVAATSGSPVAAMENHDSRRYGVQFHPEVVHTPRGTEIIKRFLFDVCQLRPNWTHHSIIEQSVEAIRSQVGSEKVMCGLSGGVDSSVAAALVHHAVGDQLTCVFIDHGLLRAREAEQVEETFRRTFHINLVHVKAQDRFLAALAGVTDPESKRKIIGETFIRVFEEVAVDLADTNYLVQGTLYPD